MGCICYCINQAACLKTNSRLGEMGTAVARPTSLLTVVLLGIWYEFPPIWETPTVASPWQDGDNTVIHLQCDLPWNLLLWPGFHHIIMVHDISSKTRTSFIQWPQISENDLNPLIPLYLTAEGEYKKGGRMNNCRAVSRCDSIPSQVWISNLSRD